MRIFSHENLLINPTPQADHGRTVQSFTAFLAYHRNVRSPNKLLELAHSRLVFESGDLDLGTQLELAKKDILTISPASQSLISDGLTSDGMPDSKQSSRNAVEPNLNSIKDMEGGLLAVERAARFLQLKYTKELPNIFSLKTASIFETVGASGLIPKEAAERLTVAATLWSHLDTLLGLVTDENSTDKGFAIETASTPIKALLTETAGLKDFGALAGHIRETASQAMTDIEQIQ